MALSTTTASETTRKRSGAIVVSWAGAVPGREVKLLDVFGRALEYGEQLRKAGRVDAVHVFVTKIGPYRDTLMVLGCLDELMAVVVGEEFQGFLLEGTIVVQNLSVSVWEGGSADWAVGGLDPYMEKLKQHGLL